MDQQLTVYLLVALLCMFAFAICTHLVMQSQKRSHMRRQREANLADRERLAEKRMTENGGKALSSRFATTATSRRESERSL